MFFLYMRIALSLAAGERAAVLTDAQRVRDLVKEAPGVWSEIYLIDRTVEAFIRMGDPDAARQLLGTAVTQAFESNPLLWRARGRLLLAEGRTSEARDLLERAARALQEARYLDEAWPARRAYAQALAVVGDNAAAEAELRAVLQEATRHHHRLEARYAREQLRAIGLEAPEPPAGGGEAQLSASIRQPTGRLVTGVFVDVPGDTALTAREAPDQLADQIATFYRWAEEEIHPHQGLVDRYA